MGAFNLLPQLAFTNNVTTHSNTLRKPNTQATDIVSLAILSTESEMTFTFCYVKNLREISMSMLN